MPVLHAQLIFRDQRLQLRPPLEELRQSFYGALRKLLGIPLRMRGVQNTENESNLFASIVSSESRRFHSLYERSEQIFSKLKQIDREFDEWTALAQVNLEELLEQHLKEAEDWERQFRVIRLKQRELDRIPMEICIECIHVSTNGVRLLANDLLRRMHDALCWTLKHSIRTELSVLDQQLTQGIEQLSALPQSMEEVSEACTAQLTLAKSVSTFRTKVNIAEEKDQVLRSLFGSEQGLADTVKQTREQFANFLNLLETHELMMRDQVKAMKGNVGASIKTLGEELEKLHSLWNQFKPRSEIFTSQDDRMALIRAVEFIREKRQEFDKIFVKIEKVKVECEQFEVEQPDWPLLNELKIDLENYESNYLLYEDFSNALQPISDQEWILFRSKTYIFDEFLQQWLEKLKAIQTSNVSVRLQKDIEQMREFSINLKFCRGDIFSADHWLEMFRLLGLPRGTSLEKLTFGNLLNSQQKLIANLEKLKELNARAHGEVSIREAIQELEMWAAQADFSLTDYKHASGASLKIVKEWKPILNQVRDNQALISSLRNSSYYAQFAEQIGIWERKISDLELFLHHLSEIQRKWVYLEPIFGRGSLPSEAARFNRIDAEFRIIINDISRDNRIISLCSGNSTALGRTLEQLVDQLNRCQRALNDFLEEKRGAFPRFYFLGDDDLLEIVGQSTNPTVIQSHLKKLFQGINRVAFDTQLQNIRAMISAEGETVQLIKPVQIVPKVEIWLEALGEEMRNTLQKLVVDCLHERSLDPSRYPSQVLCLSEQIRFCSDVEKCLSNVGGNPTENLTAYRRQLIKQLEQLSGSSTDDPLGQLKLKALVLDLIHHISILDQLVVAENNQSVICWTWRRQLRFYLVSGLVIVRHADHEFNYSYEYQGNAQKLVNTPLTDKCYLTLTHALAMGLGGNPYGPAGTGKTESVKALAGLLGRQVLVFNCDEGIDVNAISRIFVGLVQCGAWGCFDEFNRLTKGVLSAVSSQVQIIQEAVRVRASNCQIGDHSSVPVNGNSAIFVTLNPAGKGYGGRQRLPDNLKQLFRPVAMSVPDNELIAETLLFSEGYTQAKSLAKKLVTTFSLASAMLSTQQHYDWGLRALKTVLKGCADSIAKRRQDIKSQQKQQQKLTVEEERELIVQNLHLNTMSKLTFEDAQRFRILLEDIFPGVPNRTMQFDELRPHLERAAQNMQITLSIVQMHKIFELYEQLRQRVGVIIVGPPGTGKSTLWHLLQGALSNSGFQMIDVYKMNPKSMPRSRLLGNLEPDTREWTDGTLSQASRVATRDPGKPAWIVCDGDVDPEWIEALNSVLDDNRLLTLPSGERIQFGPNVNFIFECVDLSHASPATISRVGMILLSREDLPLKSVIDRFIVQYGHSLPAQLPDWINKHLVPAVEWTFEHLNRDFICSQVGIVKNVLSQIRYIQTLNQFLVYVLRTLLPYIEFDSRNEFAERVVFNGISLPDPRAPLNIFADSRSDILMAYSEDDGNILTTFDNLNILISPRMQTARETLLKWLQINKTQQNKISESEITSFYPKFENILLLGPDGSGKEYLLKSCFEETGVLQRTCLLTMHCGAQSNALHIEQLLLEHCVQVSGSGGSSGRVLKPKEHDRLLLHLKSPNLSATDIYGTSQLIAFLEQALDYNGFYDKNLEWIGLENVQIILNVSTASGAERFPLPERFASKLRVLILDSPDEKELKSICAANLRPFFDSKISKGGPNNSSSKIEMIVSAMATTFIKLTKIFTPNEHFHYVFTTGDLSCWVYSLQRYDLDEADTDQLYQCLYFEALRIFSDRLISTEHRLQLQTILNEHFPLRERSLIYAPMTGILTKENKKCGGKSMQLITKSDYSSQLQRAINRLKADHEEAISLPISDIFMEMCLALDRLDKYLKT
uniref:AAA+ ATPase domain-containing protein n=2 Tax=Meloidogyne TaxID=189290 RepID=A0A6V7WEN3_MELEN|nr:unnamed protein product [Meloidogyne enterolobii]